MSRPVVSISPARREPSERARPVWLGICQQSFLRRGFPIGSLALCCLLSILGACRSTEVYAGSEILQGYGPLEGYQVQWGPAELFRPRTSGLEKLNSMGPRVRLSGKLVRRGRRQAEELPAGMRLRIGVACRPHQSPDWDQRPGRAWLRQIDSELGVFFGSGESIEVECTLDEAGSFSGSFPARLIHRVVDGAGDYETLLSIPEGSGPAATARVSSDSTALRVAGPLPLDLTTKRINAVLAPGYGIFDPIALVRAVNHLHGLGRDGALAALTRYLEKLGSEPTWPGWRRDPRNIDTGHPGCIFPIVQLLFEPMLGRPKLPGYTTGGLLTKPSKPFAGDTDYPLLLSDGIPFLIGDWVSSELGPETDPERALDWARTHGRLRSHMLRPGGQPLAALEQLGQFEDLPAGNSPRLQIMRAFGPFVGIDFELKLGDGALAPGPGWEAEIEAEWPRFVKALERVTLRWDNSAQTYRRI